MRTFLFLALRDAALTARLLRAAGRTSATVVLDLEDALWDVGDPAATAALKTAGRETLVALARDHAPLFQRHAIGVRINPARGPEAAADFDALARAAAYAPLALVVAPKVETGDELGAIPDLLRRHRVSVRSLVPIVESRVALANLDTLLAAANAAGVRWVIYGHYDFALEAGWWPIPEHSSTRFWDHVAPLIARIEAAGLGYVHPPYLHTHDEPGLLRVLERLAALCRQEFGLLAVGLGQAHTGQRFAVGGAPAPGARRGPLDASSEGDPIALAEHTLATYRTNHRPDTGFALDPRTGEFVPPHAYLAAKRFLAGTRNA